MPVASRRRIWTQAETIARHRKNIHFGTDYRSGKTLLLRVLTPVEITHALGARMLGCILPKTRARRFRARQFFPNHRREGNAFFESVSRSAYDFESHA